MPACLLQIGMSNLSRVVTLEGMSPEVRVYLSRLYKGIDVPEILSNLTGERNRRVTALVFPQLRVRAVRRVHATFGIRPVSGSPGTGRRLLRFPGDWLHTLPAFDTCQPDSGLPPICWTLS